MDLRDSVRRVDKYYLLFGPTRDPLVGRDHRATGGLGDNDLWLNEGEEGTARKMRHPFIQVSVNIVYKKGETYRNLN